MPPEQNDLVNSVMDTAEKQTENEDSETDDTESICSTASDLSTLDHDEVQPLFCEVPQEGRETCSKTRRIRKLRGAVRSQKEISRTQYRIIKLDIIQHNMEEYWTQLYTKLVELHQLVDGPLPTVDIPGGTLPTCEICFEILELVQREPPEERNGPDERNDFGSRLSSRFMTLHRHKFPGLAFDRRLLRSIYVDLYDFSVSANRVGWCHFEYAPPRMEVVLLVTQPALPPYSIMLCLPEVKIGCNSKVLPIVKARGSLVRG